MPTDFDRERALEVLGEEGIRVREAIPEILRGAHAEMSEAQAAARMKKQVVYGQMWCKVTEAFFTRFGEFPTSTPVTLRNYSLRAFNGHILMPWRFSPDMTKQLHDYRFGTSPTRISLFQQSTDLQPVLDLDFSYEELTAAEKEALKYVSEVKSHQDDGMRVLLIPFASNSRALHCAYWGVAHLLDDGYVEYDWLEPIELSAPTRPVSTTLDARDAFGAGDIPRPRLGAAQEGTKEVEDE